MKFKNILVTGGAGFIGGDFIQLLLDKTNVNIYVVDNLTYAANMNLWGKFSNNKRIAKYEMSINDPKIKNVILSNKIDCIVNFAAETHVDNSIENATIFYETNLSGVINLIEIAKNHNIRFHQISTDEVYGALELDSNKRFEINTPLDPSSPYSSSKAAADLAVIAYGRTYNLNYTISRCGNNYGPTQHIEKLIPHSIDLILKNKKIQIYGDGKNIRDWIYVRDHNLAILQILKTSLHNSKIYNIGSENEMNNLAIAKIICEKLNVDMKDSVEFIEDRKGHDRRYAINPKSMHDIGWKPKTKFVDGIYTTINACKNI